MVFSSPTFLFLFLPIIYLLNLVVPKRFRNPLLLIASLAFYGWGEPVFMLVMVASAAANYLFALWQDHARRMGRPGRVRIAMGSMVLANIGLLLVYKYTDFLLGAINSTFQTAIPLPGIPLPIGISFFTFQAMSYVIDVYRQETPVQKRFDHLLLYISFFPQLIAGPIVKYHDVAAQIENRKLEISETAAGVRRFIIGLAKKLLIANMAGQAADRIFALDPSSLDMPIAWVGALSYAIQIYFDFAGYSDMAIGLGHMFGFTFKENFLFPYAAQSLQDFWRRWHVSLSTWFKEYLYIPLGGNRKGLLRTGLNRVVVFFFTGMWHGANWTFIVWGLYHGFFLMLETYRVIRVERFPLKVFRYLYTLLVVVVGFVIFRADTLGQGLQMIGSMFAGWQRQPASVVLLMDILSPAFVLTLLVAAVSATPVLGLVRRSLRQGTWIHAAFEPIGYVLSAGLFVLCIMALSASSYNPFIYFRF